MSERTSKVCKAVKKDVRSAGEGGCGGGSAKREASGTECPLVRAIVCLKDENPRDADAEIGEGERGRPGLGGDEGVRTL